MVPDRVTTTRLVKMKKAGKSISMLTAYDYSMASILDRAGVDILLVGDSLAMVVQGHENTLPVTMDEMIYHTRLVGRAARRALVVGDLPFPENHLGITQTVASASRFLKETQAQAVKLEGGAELAGVINALVMAGIPVMAHVGLRPQNVHVMGGYRMQRDEEVLMHDALAAEKAGAFAIVLECITNEIAAKISQRLTIPTIGIGSGPHCDGQVLVSYDLLGLTSGYVPSFVQPYANLGAQIEQSVKRWIEDLSKKSAVKQ
jgi:3-methyl-2-oxobutanoate hydroxymethyltransferase